MEAEGAYTQNKKKMIYCIISANEIGKFKDLIYDMDSEAFISVNNVEEVKVEVLRINFFKIIYVNYIC